MPIVSLATLKSYFENGKVPSYLQYVDVIDTLGVGGSGVTNGDNHDHYGGDGAVIPLEGMANITDGTVIGRPIGYGTGVPGLIDQGDGGGLDTDMLDGNHASSFLLKNSYIGTSFPSNPSNGDPFYRSDYGLLCQWNGTYWLTSYGLIASWPRSETFTITGGSVDINPIRNDFQFYLTKYCFRINPNSPQDASNYWIIYPRSVNGSFTSATALATLDTKALTTGVWNVVDGSPSINTHATNKHWLDYTANKYGSPGNILVNAVYYYRLIIA